eukprot:COSAG05_NODE_25812_length_193_cov_50.255319_1_plen_64_part_11
MFHFWYSIGWCVTGTVLHSLPYLSLAGSSSYPRSSLSLSLSLSVCVCVCVCAVLVNYSYISKVS